MSAPFARRVRGSTARPTLADQLSQPGEAAFAVRVRGSAQVRTLADHVAASARPTPTPTPTPAPAPRAPVPSDATRRPSISYRRPDRDPSPAAARPPAPAAPSVPAPAAPSARPRPAAQVSVARESERRTVLDASSPVVTLGPDEVPRSGLLTVNVDWDRQRTEGGVWRTADVHLACLWQTVDGHSGLVHSDGMRSAPGFGARQVMRLGERNEDTGEVLSVDAKHLDVMARLLVVATSRRDPPRWAEIGVHVNLDLASGARVVVRTDDPPPARERARSVALASVHLVGGAAVVRREDDFVDAPLRQVALDYGWDDLDFVADGTALRT